MKGGEEWTFFLLSLRSLLSRYVAKNRPLLTTPSESSPTMAAAPIEQRGYLFKLSPLAPPTKEYEEVLIRAVIATRTEAPALLNDDTKKASRRYAGGRNDFFDFQYEGAIWLVPVVTPQSPKAEVFTLKIRRLPLSTMKKPHRMPLPDGLSIFSMFHPQGIEGFKGSDDSDSEDGCDSDSDSSTYIPDQEDEDDFWEDANWPQLLNDYNEQYSSLSKDKSNTIMISGHPTDPQSPWNQANFDARGAVRDEWVEAQQAAAYIDKVKDTGIMPRKEPNVISKGGHGREDVRIEYAVVWHEGAAFTAEAQWKTVPPRAYKEGGELALRNQMRGLMGWKLLSQEELDKAHAAAAESSK